MDGGSGNSTFFLVVPRTDGLLCCTLCCIRGYSYGASYSVVLFDTGFHISECHIYFQARPLRCDVCRHKRPAKTMKSNKGLQGVSLQLGASKSGILDTCVSSNNMRKSCERILMNVASGRMYGDRRTSESGQCNLDTKTAMAFVFSFIRTHRAMSSVL